MVFSSDHGEMLGDHGRWGKSVWREASLRVPLIVAGPGVQEGQASDALIELIDVEATLLDYAGGDSTPGQEALSLRRLLEGRVIRHREYQVSELGNWRLVTDGEFKLVVEGEVELLFDLEADEQETANCLQQNPNVARQLRVAMRDVFGRLRFRGVFKLRLVLRRQLLLGGRKETGSL